MSQPPRVLFYFLHLLGVGHVFRAKRLIEGFHAAGIATDVIYGGFPVPEMEFKAECVTYLPPIKAADNTYASYIDDQGNALTPAYMEMRKQAVLESFSKLSPDLILTEAYPFGRRMVRHEIKALMETAQTRPNKPIIVSSVRDILQEKRKPERLEETCEVIDAHFDHILVHSDPNIIRLDDTFSLASKIADKLHYTGFVLPSHASTGKVEPYDVIVSAGGGAFGGDMMKTAMDAAHLRPDWKWCLSTGPNLDAATVNHLQQNKPDHVTLTSSLDDLSAHMKHAKISVSQCGYNTAMDVLSAHQESKCRAVFVPYDTEGQTEQLRRAQLLEKAGYAINLPQSVLTSDALLNAMDKAGALPRVQHKADFNGVTNTAQIVKSWIEQR